MPTTLSGTGQSSGWEIDIDEISETNSFGLQIRAKDSFYLQIGNVEFASIEGMLMFLRLGTSGRFRIAGLFGGAVDLTHFEDTLSLIAVDERAVGSTNSLTIRIRPEDRPHFVHALADAIIESKGV